MKLPGTVDTATHSITVSTETLGVFALGVDSLATFDVGAVAIPANGGVITGAGTFAEGAIITLALAPNSGYVFTHWSEGAAVVGASPTLTFLLQADRVLEANFALVGTGKVVSTGSTPTAGGSTSGGGEYPLGASATVRATPNAGYKFSKWLVNGASVSTAASYPFTVSGDRTLVAKFKPVYSVAITAEPSAGGEPEGDPLYEVGELAKLKSKPMAGWSLVSWTENGVEVSTDVDFSFNVNGNRTLVANYALGERIDLAADPKTAGDVGGAGVFPAGSAVAVTAAARPGYVFIEWTENGDPVSPDANYTFTSGAPRTLVARFAALPGIVAGAAPTPGQLLFTWPDNPSWSLEESTDLVTWSKSTRTVETTAGQNAVTAPTSDGRLFFRLRYQ